MRVLNMFLDEMEQEALYRKFREYYDSLKKRLL